MKENKNDFFVIQADSISEKKINEIKEQLINVPEFWKDNFRENGWQLTVTNKMPKRKGKNKAYLILSRKDKKLYVKIKKYASNKNVIYKAFAFYIDELYLHLEKSQMDVPFLFSNHMFKFMMKRNASISIWDVFAELFSYVIETKGKNQNALIEEEYQFAKKWANGTIFDKNIKIPDNFIVDKYVTDYQIRRVIAAFDHIPSNITILGVINDWKIKVQNEGYDISFLGECSFEDKIITISAEQGHLETQLWYQFGHYLDDDGKYGSNNKYFLEIYEKEKECIKTLCENEKMYKYYIEKPERYYAKIFTLYIRIPLSLEEYAPDSKYFMASLLKNNPKVF